MALCELHYFSNALGKQHGANVIFPQDKTGPFPVMYLLHGLSDDHTIWLRRTSIERYVQDLPLMVVMPDGGRGFYLDAHAGFAYGSALVDELVALIDRTFPTQANRDGRCVTGLSMGGYGAARFALAYPERFCSAVSHSGAVGFGHWPDDNLDDPRSIEFKRLIGPNFIGGENDLYALAEKRASEAQPPALRIDCGVDDFLIEDNRKFHAHLEKIGYSHEYAEFPGAHTWDYWDVHVQEAIRFHQRHLTFPE